MTHVPGVSPARGMTARRRHLVANLGLLLFSALVVAPVVGELGLRAGIRLGIPALRDPRLYADYFTDDDYWRLQHAWGAPAVHPAPERVDPVLGWAPSRSPANPFGAHPPVTTIDASTPALLFYG